MNYSTIQLAREELNRYQNDYQELVKKVNLSLFSIAGTTFNTEKKRKVWQELSQYTKNIISKAENILDKLNNVRFAESEIILQEEKENIENEYIGLINNLRKEKETILRQIEKETSPAMPLRQKIPKSGYCYFCDIDITGEFPYKLKKEEQMIAGVEIMKGAEFCSQECLLGYCKEYKNREKLRQEEGKRNKEKIERDKQLVTKIQEEITSLITRINELEKKERELELNAWDIETSQPKPGFWKRLGKKMGVVKANDPYSHLERIKKKKMELKVELEQAEQEQQKALIILSISKQVEEERKRLVQKSSQEKEKLAIHKEKEKE